MTSRERVMAMLDGRPVDHLPFMPILMQFAGDRLGVDYKEYATNYRELVEGQIRAAEEFGIDHVNTMSDPAGEAADCGAAVRFFTDQPPALDESNSLLVDKGKLPTLVAPDPYQGGRMHNRLRALALYKERLGKQKLIEGWIEGPCAQAANLRGISRLMTDFFEDPKFVCELLEFVVTLELRFAQAQIAEGAELVGIGDAAASLVGPRIYEQFVWPYQKRLVDGLRTLGARVRLHICGNTQPILEGIHQLRCNIVDLDHLVSLAEARASMGPDQILLGNIDPVRVLRDGNPLSITEAISECHRQAGPRYIIGAGCEVPRDTPAENLRALGTYALHHAP